MKSMHPTKFLGCNSWTLPFPIPAGAPGPAGLTKRQKQGWASRPEFRVLSLGLLADTRLLGKTAQTRRFFSRGVER